MSRSDIDDTVREMWTTRPRRHKDNKIIGGVAAAIARRYQIDPVLVRVGFVVATVFSGVGIVLYLAGWLLLPAEGDEVSGAEAVLGRGRSSMSTTLACVLGLAMIPASAGMFSGAPGSLVGLLVVGGALFLLHRHRGHLGAPVYGPAFAGPVSWPSPMPPFAQPPAGPAGMAPMAPSVSVDTGGRPTDTVTDTPTGEPATDVPPVDTPPGPAAGHGHRAMVADGPNPPAWDPLGVAPFAWDLPDPTPAKPPAPPPPKHRSRVTPVTLALALIAGGIAAVTATVDRNFGPTEVVATVLAVLGVGLVAGSFVRGGRGLIWFALPLAMATWMMAVVPFDEYADVGMGNKEWAETNPAELRDEYKVFMGNGELDLSQLELSAGQRVETEVRHLLTGNLTVIVPDDVDVEAVCTARAGDVDCLGERSSGPNANTRADNDIEDTTATIDLTIKGGLGNVELVREG